MNTFFIIIMHQMLAYHKIYNTALNVSSELE